MLSNCFVKCVALSENIIILAYKLSQSSHHTLKFFAFLQSFSQRKNTSNISLHSLSSVFSFVCISAYLECLTSCNHKPEHNQCVKVSATDPVWRASELCSQLWPQPMLPSCFRYLQTALQCWHSVPALRCFLRLQPQGENEHTNMWMEISCLKALLFMQRSTFLWTLG